MEPADAVGTQFLRNGLSRLSARTVGRFVPISGTCRSLIGAVSFFGLFCGPWLFMAAIVAPDLYCLGHIRQ